MMSPAEHETEGNEQYQHSGEYVDGTSEHILVHRVAFQMPPRQVGSWRTVGPPKAGVGQPSKKKQGRFADDVMTRIHFA